MDEFLEPKNRREILGLSGVALTTLAGCQSDGGTSDGDDGLEDTPEPTPTETRTPTQTPTATPNPAGLNPEKEDLVNQLSQFLVPRYSLAEDDHPIIADVFSHALLGKNFDTNYYERTWSYEVEERLPFEMEEVYPSTVQWTAPQPSVVTVDTIPDSYSDQEVRDSITDAGWEQEDELHGYTIHPALDSPMVHAVGNDNHLTAFGAHASNGSTSQQNEEHLRDNIKRSQVNKGMPKDFNDILEDMEIWDGITVFDSPPLESRDEYSTEFDADDVLAVVSTVDMDEGIKKTVYKFENKSQATDARENLLTNGITNHYARLKSDDQYLIATGNWEMGEDVLGASETLSMPYI